MKFKKTVLYKVLLQVASAFRRMNLYSIILAIPMICFVLVVGISAALIIDMFHAWRSVFEYD